jgi:phosphonate transport system permease protein
MNARVDTVSRTGREPTPARDARLRDVLDRHSSINLRAWLAAAVFMSVLVYSAVEFGLLGAQFVNGLGKLGSTVWMMFPPSGFEYLPTFLWSLAETIAMAFLGTSIAAVLALPVAFMAARTTLPVRILQFGFRRFADSLRTLDYLIWALVFVRAIGLGPMAGILAIAVVEFGTLIKLFSEAIDNCDRRPVEGVRAAGGSRLDEIRYGVLPQIMPNLLSATLYMWESNTRSATILGIVGAGGIGYYLADRLRVYEWGQASLIILLIVAAVYAIDFISSRVRSRLIAGRS